MKKHHTQLLKVTPAPTPKQANQGVMSLLLTRLFLLPILAYQYLIAPLITDCCRYYPSCSTYTKAAMTKYGIFKGIWLGIKRLARCHPWGSGGYDPVP